MVRQKILDDVVIITIDRPHARNAVDRETAEQLEAAFEGFVVNDSLKVAILTGSDGHFCAGADLKAIAAGVFHCHPWRIAATESA